MAFASKSLPAAAVLALLSLGACATAPTVPVSAVQTAPGFAAPGLAGAPPVQPYPAVAYSGYGAGGALAAIQPQPQVRFQPVSTLEQPLPALERHDGLLSSPPNDARPGECYAKVVVPGQPIASPPAQPRAVWVQSPPWPGQASPSWCIYYLPGAPQPVMMSPERFGWIRVVCDRDATEDKIRHVQRRLHDWGDYDGAYDGRFGPDTAHGVARFQEQRHIDHGGYLSIQTVDALETAPPPPATYVSPVYQAQASYAAPAPAPPAPAYPTADLGAAYASPCGPASCLAPPPAAYAPPPPPPPPSIIVQRQVVVQRVIQPVYVQPAPVYAPPPPPQTVVQRVIQPVYMQPAPFPAACAQPACAPQPYPCGGPTCASPGGQPWGGYAGGYAPQPAAPRQALLSWPGKTVY